jgi:2-haloacid dehalogenase
MERRPQAVLFDVMGTLFDLSSLETRLTDIGAPPGTLTAWFQRTLHEASTVTVAGSYRPFKELAAAALRTTLAQLELDRDATGPLEGLAELDPYPDADAALRRIRAAGLRIVALTNGSAESTEKLLRRGGLDDHVEQILSCDQVQAYKPHAAPYDLARRTIGGEATMIAAHGWDILGARAAGLPGIWIDREERVWPFPLEEPPRAHDLAEAAELIAG